MSVLIYPSLQQPVPIDPSRDTPPYKQWADPNLNTKVRAKAFHAASELYFFFYPEPLGTPEFIFPDKWWQQWRERLYPKPGLRAELQQFLAMSESAQFPEVVYIDKYLYPFGLPVWHKARLETGSQPYFSTGAHALGTAYARGYVIC